MTPRRNRWCEVPCRASSPETENESMLSGSLARATRGCAKTGAIADARCRDARVAWKRCGSVLPWGRIGVTLKVWKDYQKPWYLRVLVSQPPNGLKAEGPASWRL